MGILQHETFDVPTAPATPSGWTFDAGYATVASLAGGLSPTSSPNVLATGTTNAYTFGTYGTPDGNSGNVTLQCNVAFPAYTGTHKGRAAVTARGSAAALNLTSTSWYAAWLDVNQGAVGISKGISGTQTNLGTAGTSALAINTWYTILFTCNGTSLTLQVFRLADNFYLNSSGTFVNSVATAVQLADSAVSGSGYAGVYGAIDGGSSGAYFDDWYLSTLPPPVPPPVPHVVPVPFGFYPSNQF